jgi:hypothetical protein
MLDNLEGPVGAYTGFDIGLATTRLKIIIFLLNTRILFPDIKT